MDPFGYLEELVIVFILIGANGILSMLEMALVSSRKTRLEQMLSDGNKKAGYILKLVEDPTEFLSTVQIGITLVGIGTGVYSGAALAASLAAVFHHIPVLDKYAGPLAYGLVVAAVTYLSIILGELIPKRIAISEPEKMVTGFASLIKILVRVFKPLTMLLSYSTKYILKLLGMGKESNEPPITEDEVKLLIKQGTASGVFNADEQKIIENTFELDDLRVREIMTPRTKISWLDIKDEEKSHLAQITEKRYSCFVVADDDLDHVLGVIYTKRFLLQRLKNNKYSVKEAVQQPLYVPENMRTQNLLNMFKKERIKVALVVDEFGSLAGMVTFRDVVEHILGDVPSFDEENEPQIVQRDSNSWLVDGLLSINDFIEYFELDENMVEHTKEAYNTVGGLVVAILGYIPKAGDKVNCSGLSMEVVDMDGARVDKIMVSKVENAKEAQKDEE